ncbi:hypothetical protein BS101_20145 [Clostridium kluyveri]|uniref:STAS domain-containing protein n=2 Tax=Clostridium kluyveri TaxID=1534 RepID=A0A1L5FCW4_CLOKL|nr:hypothetical protein BS101_20145 [Clostridium kluyveri]
MGGIFMYKLEIKPEKNIFLITFKGLLSKKEGEEFLSELLRKLKTFDTSKYNLVVDTQELKVSTQDSTDNIKSTIELLVKTPFKGRYNVVPKSIIAELQAKRVVKNDIFNKITPIKSYESLLKSSANL